MKYKKIIIQNNKDLDKFFNKNKKYKSFIKDTINKNTIKLIEEKPYKIKTCGGLKYEGKTIYEYKISYNKFSNWRVAYIYKDDDIIIFFISNIIIKNEFVKLLTNVRGVSK